jgi:hypothetical protein
MHTKADYEAERALIAIPQWMAERYESDRLWPSDPVSPAPP